MASVAMKFERPVGIQRDIAEFQFITAMLQTTPKGNLRNYITAEDITIYLRSRHEIDVNEANVRKLIIQDLAGSTSGDIDHDGMSSQTLESHRSHTFEERFRQSMNTMFFYTAGNKDQTYETFCYVKFDDDAVMEDCMQDCISQPEICDIHYKVVTDN